MSRARAAAPEVPRLSWSEFVGRWQWNQGEHVTLVGPTGVGKSTLGLALLPFRQYTLALGTKPRDATLSRLTRRDAPARHVKRERWNDRRAPSLEPRLLLWPRMRTPSDVHHQAEQVGAALADVFTEGGWCIYVDELTYLVRQLGQADVLRLIWQQGRALGISLVGATQRPAWVPLEMYSQATHVFLWRHNDPRDLDRISGIAAAGNVDPRSVRALVGTLPRYEFLHVDTRSGEMTRSAVEQ